MKDRLRTLLNANFTDRVDASLDISLFEYGIIRNPKTGFTIFCIPAGIDGKDYLLDWTTINTKDVLEVLAEMPDGFYSCLGSDKDEYIQCVKDFPKDIATVIDDINSYNGWWRDACQYDSNKFALRRLARN